MAVIMNNDIIYHRCMSLS